jgi:hypothetical protein
MKPEKRVFPLFRLDAICLKFLRSRRRVGGWNRLSVVGQLTIRLMLQACRHGVLLQCAGAILYGIQTSSFASDGVELTLTLQALLLLLRALAETSIDRLSLRQTLAGIARKA